MQEDFTTIDTPLLVDMLSNYTAGYTKLMTDGTREDFEICKLKISLIQQELQRRTQQSENSTNVSDTNIEFIEQKPFQDARLPN